MRLRKAQPVFRRRNFFQGRPIHGAEIKDLYWLKPDGREMSDRDWASGFARCLGMVLLGDQIAEVSEHGDRIVGDSFAILLNAHREPISFRLGTRQRDVSWTCVLDTAAPDAGRRMFEHMSEFPLQALSLALLRAELQSIPSKT
jgi:isoamylase